VRYGEHAVTARVLNASLGGLFLELEEKLLPLGARLHVRFEVVGHVVESNAVVRWHGERGLGIQFDGLRARDVWALEKFFKSL
jgi:PilZ domain